MQIEYPQELLFLINSPARYKILYGGRGGMKTESIALALIILSTQKKLRIACFREIQKSIEESVYQTIVNRINEMDWGDKFDKNNNFIRKTRPDEIFDIQKTSITCKVTGSELIFFGLRYNINSIKSLARIDIAWVEEAVNVSKVSWDKLTPTIRGRGKNIVLENIDENKGGPFGKGTEIWISFNPELDTDETYKRYVLKRDAYAPDYVINEQGEKIRYAYVKMLSYKDNPWLPDDLRIESELLKHADEDEWLHVWGGQTKQTLTGAIYAKEIKKVLLEGRRGSVRYDPSRPVHTFWDLGHNDYTSIWFIQQVGVEYNLINYYQNKLEKIPHYLEKLQELKYSYGFHHLPHDADNETLASRSVARIVRDAYPGKVKVIPRVAKKEHGIRAARLVFDLCNFDEENTADGWQSLCRYHWKVNEDGKMSQNPDHDDDGYSDGADAFQTFALSLKSEIAVKKKKVSTGPKLNVHTNVGWMR